jgi:basic amino acid/polyamine antiporter, APA family
VYALIGTGHDALLWGGILVVAGLPLHVWRRHRQLTSAVLKK